MTGPFSIDVPAREVDFGRRFVVEVFGERRLPMDTLMAYPDGEKGTGWGWTEEEPGDHAACRPHAEESEAVPAPAGAGQAKRDQPDGRNQGKSPRRNGEDGRAHRSEAAVEAEAEVALPTLPPHEGPLPGMRRLAGALGWFPRGKPKFHNLDDIPLQYYDAGGERSFRFQFWFHRPVDTLGVVIRIRDELMVPIGSIEAYRARFSARVAEAENRRKRARVITVEASGARFRPPSVELRGRVKVYLPVGGFSAAADTCQVASRRRLRKLRSAGGTAATGRPPQAFSFQPIRKIHQTATGHSARNPQMAATLIATSTSATP